MPGLWGEVGLLQHGEIRQEPSMKASCHEIKKRRKALCPYIKSVACFFLTGSIRFKKIF